MNINLGHPLDEVDWAAVERQIERQLRAEEPGSCHHYRYPIGTDGVRYVQGESDIVAVCTHCGDPL